MLVIPGAEEAQAAAAANGEPTIEAPTNEEISETQELESDAEPESTPDPSEALNQELAAEREQRIRLEERLAAQGSQSPPQKEAPPKDLTRVQFREAVDNGQLSEDQMEQMWSDQERAKTLRETGAMLDQREIARSTTSVVETDTAKYLASHPDIRTVGTSDWNRLKGEYDFLRSVGDPDNKTTELKAMRAAFGSPDRVRESSSSRRQAVSETATSQGGSGSDGRSANIWTKVPSHIRPALKEMVANGTRTLEDIKADLPYMRERPS